MAITKINTPELFDLGAANSALRLPSGGTASRPSSPSTGEWRYNTDDNKVEYWDGSAWFQIDYEAPTPTTVVPEENFSPNTYLGNGSTNALSSKIGNAGYFNGSSSYIDLGTNTFNSLTNFTFSCWVYMNTTPVSPGHYLFDGFDYQSATSRGTIIRINSSRQVEAIGYNSNTLSTATSTNTVTVGQWTHIACTYTQSSTVIYINGNAETPQSTSGFNYHTGTPFTLGAFTYTSNPYQYFLNGKLDQVRIFNTALTSQQVGQLYLENSYSATTKSTTDFFGNGTGIALYELDGNSYSSNFEQAAVFNGAASSAEKIVLDTFSMPTNDFTISAWVYPDFLSSSSGYNMILTTAKTNTGGYLYFTFSHNYLNYYGNTSAGEALLSSSTLTGGQWYHCVITKSSTTGTVLYLNNNVVASSGSQTSALLSNATAGGENTIGAYNTGSSSLNSFDGRIDQMRIYDTALDASDVAKLYNESSQIPTANLIAHYQLDGNATDETGSYNGTPYSITYSGGVYSGTDTNVGYQGTAFEPDFVWIKAREASASHALFDSVRGVNNILSSESTSGQTNLSPYGLTSFNSDGFTVSDISSGANAVNGSPGGTYSGSGAGYAAWCWKAGGPAVPDSSTGTLAANISANTAAGFSIVNYTGNQTSGATFPHGLNSAPEMVIIKNKSASSTYWFVYHKDLSTNYNVYLNTADSQQADNQMLGADANVVTVGSSTSVNSSTTDSMIAYCFHSVDNFSRIGSYTSLSGSSVQVYTDSNGDGTGTGAFKPRFVMIKLAIGGSSAYTGWTMFDEFRDPNTTNDNPLYANKSQQEGLRGNGTGSAAGSVDVQFNDSGFLVDPGPNNDGETNEGGGSTYIYLAIA